MKNTVKLAVSIVFAISVAAMADTLYIRLDATDFSQPGSYTNSAGSVLTELPGSSDVVVLPPNGHYTVTCGSAGFDAINGFGRISPSRGSTITFVDASAEDDYTLECPITYASTSIYDYGEIIKDGPGKLVLGAFKKVVFNSASYDYHTAITVKGGTLSGYHMAETTTTSFYYGILSISNNATFVMPGSSEKEC